MGGRRRLRVNVLRCARSFEPSGLRAPNRSQEVAWLELSGGVRSLPQVPWWNAERRARPDGRAPCREGTEVTEQRLSAFRFPFRHCEERLRRSNPDSVPPTLDCFVASLLAMTRIIRA